MQSYYLSMHFQCWKVHVFKVFKQFCLPFALRLAQAGQQPAGHTPVCCDRCELNSILAMKGNKRKEERRRESEREREHSSCSSGSARKCFQCSKRKQLKHSPRLCGSERESERDEERGRKSDMCCKLQTLPACLPRLAVIWLADTQVLVNSLAHKNAST